MAQHDYNIANQSFPSFRTDLNNALSAIQTCNSGTSRPTGAVAGQIWLDTTSATSPTLKIYDGADDISLATINYTSNTVDWLDSSVTITGLSTTATGTVLTLSDSSLTSSVNLILQNQKEIRFSETTANGVNYVGFKAPASLSADKIWVLPSADGTAGQFLKTDGAGNLSFSSDLPTTSFTGATAETSIADSDLVLIYDDSATAVRKMTKANFATGLGGAIKQVVFGTDETQYSISIGNSTTDYAGSTAFSITPTSASNKIIINFSIGQIRASTNSGGGNRIRLYRQINSTGGFTHVTALSGTGSSSRLGAVVGNIHGADTTAEDANRSRVVSMMVVDSPATTSLVEYKIYVGHGDGSGTVYINRTPNDTDNNYTSRTRTHVTLMETS